MFASLRWTVSSQLLHKIPCELVVADVSTKPVSEANSGQPYPTDPVAAMLSGPDNSLAPEEAAVVRLMACSAGANVLCWFCGVEWWHSGWRQDCTCTSQTPDAAPVLCTLCQCCLGAIPLWTLQVGTDKHSVFSESQTSVSTSHVLCTPTCTLDMVVHSRLTMYLMPTCTPQSTACELLPEADLWLKA